MAKVIEFYVPKNFRKPLRTAAQPQLGKIIEFCPQTKSAWTSPSRYVRVLSVRKALSVKVGGDYGARLLLSQTSEISQEQLFRT